jgi:hypothetical protein
MIRHEIITRRTHFWGWEGCATSLRPSVANLPASLRDHTKTHTGLKTYLQAAELAGLTGHCPLGRRFFTGAPACAAARRFPHQAAAPRTFRELPNGPVLPLGLSSFLLIGRRPARPGLTPLSIVGEAALLAEQTTMPRHCHIGSNGLLEPRAAGPRGRRPKPSLGPHPAAVAMFLRSPPTTALSAPQPSPRHRTSTTLDPVRSRPTHLESFCPINNSIVRNS